jgi:hypothetical protein
MERVGFNVLRGMWCYVVCIREERERENNINMAHRMIWYLVFKCNM